MDLVRSVTPRSDDQGRGGRTRRLLAIGALWSHQDVLLYDPRGGVGARDTPNIRGRREETLDKLLATLMGL